MNLVYDNSRIKGEDLNSQIIYATPPLVALDAVRSKVMIMVLLLFIQCLLLLSLCVCVRARVKSNRPLKQPQNHPVK